MRNKTFNVILSLLVGVIFAVSCGPAAQQRRSERKLAKLVAKNPNLVHTDTTFKDTAFAVPTVKDSASVNLPVADTAAVDSLLEHFRDNIPAPVLDSLSDGFKAILKDRDEIDTTVKTSRGTFHISNRDGNLKVVAELQPDSLKATIPVEVNTVKPNAVLTWYEEVFLWIGKRVGITGMGLLLLFLIYVCYRVARWWLTRK